MIRCYLATTVELLAEHLAAGQIRATTDVVIAEAADEEAEYDALMTAAEQSQALLDGAGRRIVLVAELPDEATATAGFGLDRLQAVHADPQPRPQDADPDEPLGWYAVQELDQLLES